MSITRICRPLREAGLLAVVLLCLVAPAAMAGTADSTTMDPGSVAPSILSDQADYAPGDTVSLFGSGWQPGEPVHITVNDDTGSSWNRDVDVTANASGDIADSFNLPGWFVAKYAVKATGASGSVATTSFTDSNVKLFAPAGGVSFVVNGEERPGSSTCGGATGKTNANLSVTTAGVTAGGVNTGESLLVTITTQPAGSKVTGWTTTDGGVVTNAGDTNDATWCFPGGSGPSNYIAVYTSTATPTVASINRAATDPTNAGSVSWTVTFSESVTGVGSGDFTLAPTGLGGTPAITGVTGSGATYTVTASTGSGSGTLGLNLVDDDSIASTATSTKLGGTGAGNGNFTGQTYTIDRSAPTIAASAVTLPDNVAYTAGTWTNKSVRVTFACTDTGGSGKATDTASGSTDFTAETTTIGATATSGGTCTDNAGNVATAATLGPIKIDKTAPTITDLGPTTSANGNGWYRTDVTDRFQAQDALSGLSVVCQSAFAATGATQSRTTSGEGTARTVTSDTCTDAAGNSAAAVTSAAFKVDKTAPAIADLGPTTSPDASTGWYTSDVTDRFQVSDPLSGPDSACTTAFPTVVSGGRTQSKTTTTQGSAVKVTSDSCTDLAGNTAPALDSAAFKIDKGIPASSASAPSATKDSPFVVAYTASDTGPSGLKKVELYVQAPGSATYVLTATDAAPSATGSFSYTPAAGEGTYRFYTLAYDVAGNVEAVPTGADTVTVIQDTTTVFDATAPVTTDDADASWHNAQVLVTLSAVDGANGSGVDHTFYKVDAGSFTTGSSVTMPAPADHSNDGPHTISYYSTDKASNVEAIKTATIRIDTTAPSIANAGPTTSPNGAGWYKADVVNRFKATDALSGLDAACVTAFPAGGGENVQSKTTTGEGTAVKVSSSTCTDRAGNTASAIDSAAFKVDKTAPALEDLHATTAPNAAGWYKVDVVNRFRASDGLSGLDAACLTAYPDVAGERVQAKTTSGEGTNVDVASNACTDVAGNTAAAISSAAFKIDKTAPTIADGGPTSHPNGAGWYSADVTNTFTATDATSGPDVACATAFPGGTQTKTTSGEGPAVKVSSDPCTDVAGNTAAAVDSAAFQIDQSTPTSKASSPAATNTDPFAVQYTASDGGDSGLSKVELYVKTPNGSGYVPAGTDSSPAASGAFSYTPADGQGTYRFYTRAYDVAGNVEAIPTGSDTVTVIEDAATIYDTTAPVTTDDADAHWHNSQVTVTLTPTDGSGVGVAGTVYKVDDAATFTAGTSVVIGAPADHSNDGSHTIAYYSTDKAGNQEPAQEARVLIDTRAPSITDLGPTTAANGNGWYKADVVNRFKATDGGSGLSSACASDFAAGLQSKMTTGEGTDRNVTSDSCTDNAGNTATGVDSATFKVDKTAPAITDRGPTAGPNASTGWYQTDVTNGFQATDALSGLDAACVTAFPADGSGDNVQSRTTSAEGEHVTIESASCTDRAGNTAEKATSAEFKVDKTAPTIGDGGATSSPNPAGWYSADVTNTFTASDATSGLDAACATAFAGGTQTKTTTAEGVAVNVSSDPCTDVAGNTAPAIDSAAFKVDKSKPSSKASSPAYSKDASFDVTYTAADQPGLSGLDTVELWVKVPGAADYTPAGTDSTPGATGSFTYTPDAGEGTYRFYTLAHDVAGNDEAVPTGSDASVIVEDASTIQDATAPVTTADADALWHNSDVTVTLTATDTAASGVDATSGVDKTFYTVDSGPLTTGSSVLVPAPADGSDDGPHTISFYSVDKAGNQEPAHEATVRIDTTAPSITDLGPTTAENGAHWYKTDVTNRFQATDGGSGLSAACVADFPADHGNNVQSKITTGEGTDRNVTSASCTDVAGNTATGLTSASFKVDKTAPLLEDLHATTSPNTAGWYKTDVVNRFRASDRLSGLDTACLTAYPDVAGERVQSKTTSGEGTNIAVPSDACTDVAGNTAAAISSAAFHVDKTAPTISDGGATSGPNPDGWYRTDVTNTFTVADGGSGLDSACLAAFAGGTQTQTTSGEGTDRTATSDSCADVAGNTAAAIHSVTFKVDKSKPSSKASSPATSNSASFAVSYTAADQAGLSGLKRVELYVKVPGAAGYALASTDGTPSASGSFTYTPGAGDGTYRFYTIAYDVAGNAEAEPAAGPDASVVVDTVQDTNPPVTTNDADALWHNGDVTVTLTATDTPADGVDATSGVDKTFYKVDGAATDTEGTAVLITAPASHSHDGPHTITYYSTDKAGNREADKTATVRIDTTAPTITNLGPTTDPNGDGWYRTDVTNRYRVTDGGSGLDSACLAAFPADNGDRAQVRTTTNEGTDRKVTSSSCTDVAGNTAAGVDSATFKVDKSKPSSKASSPATSNTASFAVSYTASDQAGLSGLKKVELYVKVPNATSYALADTDNAPQASGSFTYTPTGEGTYAFYTVAYDVAGNVESDPSTGPDTSVTVAKTIQDVTAPWTNNDSDGLWHNAGVTVALTATDAAASGVDATSGVDKTYYKIDLGSFTTGTSVTVPAPADHSNDGPHAITYYSTDKAGNVEATRTTTVRIDTTNPVITRDTAADQCSVPGDNAWCRGTQTAGFQATDGGAGLATDGASSRKFTKSSSTDGSAVQIGSGTVSDRAGNTATAISAGPFKIDGTAPTVTCDPTPTFTLGQTGALVTAKVADGTSQPKAVNVSSPATTSPVGSRTVSVGGADNAGNTATSSCGYKIEYGWNGFRQPINDTAHMTGALQSRFKLGSTVPAKFIITNVAGQSVQQSTLPTFRRTDRLRACDDQLTAEVTDANLAVDGDTAYNWDGSQYQYNWSTKGIKTTGVYRLYANLADGSSRWVDICLW